MNKLLTSQKVFVVSLCSLLFTGLPVVVSAATTNGCVAANEVYACAATATDPLLKDCPTPITNIISDWCGKTASVNPNALLYGCKAADGKYACAYSPASSKVTACADKKEINKTWCGKTDAEIAAAGNASTSTSTTGGTDPNQVVATFDNPLAGTANTLPELFMRLLKIFLSMIGGLAVFMIIVGGFQLVMSQGDSEAAEKGKKTITYAIMGVVLALLSFAMIAIVQNLVGAPVVDPSTIMNRK